MQSTRTNNRDCVCILILKLTLILTDQIQPFVALFFYLLSLLCSTFDSNNLFDLSIGSTIKIIFQENKYYPNYLKWCSKFGLFFVWYEDVFNRFVHEINTLAAYQWWEGSIYSILCILAYPLAWSWQQWRRRNKLQRLREFVCSEYDHSCLQSCRSRALYEGLKVWLGFLENSNPFSLGHSHNFFMCL